MKYAVVFAVMLLVAITAEPGECGLRKYLSGVKRKIKNTNCQRTLTKMNKSCPTFLQENGYQECLNSPKTADQTAESPPEEDPVFMA
ncbi:unnamed protein product [Boreogadus saida]